MSATPSASQQASTRLHGLDALRAGALGLGILLHSLLPFVPGMPWLISDSDSTPAAAVVTDWIHLFRMVLFMALAGYFGRMVVQRRGSRRFLKDRAMRIGLPVLAFWPLAVLPLGLLAALGAAMRGQEIAPPQPTPGTPGILLLFTPGHLWFLVVLMQCVLISLAVRALTVRLLGREPAGQLARRIGDGLSSPAGVFLAAVPYLVCLLLQGTVMGGIHEPATILPSLTALTAYLGAFAVGWFLHARTGSLDRIGLTWRVHLAAAVMATIAGWIIEPGQLPLGVHAAMTALAGWTWTFALIGMSARFLHRESPAMRYLADASYWSYLMHLPVLVAIQIFLADLTWPILIKLVFTWTITALVLLGSYEGFVRSTWIGKWLNGHRRERALSTSAASDLNEEIVAGR